MNKFSQTELEKYLLICEGTLLKDENSYSLLDCCGDIVTSLSSGESTRLLLEFSFDEVARNDYGQVQLDVAAYPARLNSFIDAFEDSGESIDFVHDHLDLTKFLSL